MIRGLAFLSDQHQFV